MKNNIHQKHTRTIRGENFRLILFSFFPLNIRKKLRRCSLLQASHAFTLKCIQSMVSGCVVIYGWCVCMCVVCVLCICKYQLCWVVWYFCNFNCILIFVCKFFWFAVPFTVKIKSNLMLSSMNCYFKLAKKWDVLSHVKNVSRVLYFAVVLFLLSFLPLPWIHTDG